MTLLGVLPPDSSFSTAAMLVSALSGWHTAANCCKKPAQQGIGALSLCGEALLVQCAQPVMPTALPHTVVGVCWVPLVGKGSLTGKNKCWYRLRYSVVGWQ